MLRGFITHQDFLIQGDSKRSLLGNVLPSNQVEYEHVSVHQILELSLTFLSSHLESDGPLQI